MNSEELDNIKNIVDKINDELDVLAKYLEENKIDYKPTLLNLETKSNGENRYYKEMKLQIELIKKV